jgi:uncharacterized protein (DUF305 family)
MQKKQFIVIIITLVIGMGLGYVSGGHGSDKRREYDGYKQSHMMPDGSMMSDSNTGMRAMMHDMNASLIGKSGEEFDKVFISEMVVHHEGAVQMAQLALTSAKHQEIKDLAQNIITAQNKEIAEMKSWAESWFVKK